MAKEIPIADPVRTTAIINRYLGHAKKNLGQNFLVDLNAIQQIVAAAKIGPGDQVIEIGPGIGSLTEQLLNAGAQVASYEVDPDLPEILRNELPRQRQDHFKLIMKDVLKADFANDIGDFFDFKRPIKVVANLPYYITTPIIFNLADSDLDFASLTLMMQKEVAQRLAAHPGTKAYGPLTIAVQTELAVKVNFEVSHRSFMPQPKVDSSVVTLTPLAQKPAIADRRYFNWVVKMCFAQRRKTLANNLKSLLPSSDQRQELLKKLQVDPRVRPEALALDQFILISNYVRQHRN